MGGSSGGGNEGSSWVQLKGALQALYPGPHECMRVGQRSQQDWPCKAVCGAGLMGYPQQLQQQQQPLEQQ